MKRKKSFLIFFLFYLFTSLIQNGNSKNSKSGSGRKSFGRNSSKISSISGESTPNYDHFEYGSDKIVAEEYVQKLVGTNQYFLPEPIDADIFCYEDINEDKSMKKQNDEKEAVGEERAGEAEVGEEAVGEASEAPKDLKGCKFITSKDRTVAKMFEYIYLKIDKVGVRKKLEKVLFPADKCNIGFPLPKNIFGKSFLLDSALTFSEEGLEELVHGEEKMVYVKPESEEGEGEEEIEDKEEEDDDDDEGDVRLSTLILLEVIYKGSKGLGGKDIFLDWEKIPEKEYKYEKGKRQRMKKTAKKFSKEVRNY
uniref:Uncharacterized protein n=1 Tax=Meloidogyne enterolobii TaxID=390850 RepID=A0A6V7Y1U4_MELEN|nr:unnamed protein product [Meloidogyne enterolobii]